MSNIVVFETGQIAEVAALVLEDQPDFSVVASRGTELSPVPSTRLRGL